MPAIASANTTASSSDRRDPLAAPGSGRSRAGARGGSRRRGGPPEGSRPPAGSSRSSPGSPSWSAHSLTRPRVALATAREDGTSDGHDDGSRPDERGRCPCGEPGDSGPRTRGPGRGRATMTPSRGGRGVNRPAQYDRPSRLARPKYCRGRRPGRPRRRVAQPPWTPGRRAVRCLVEPVLVRACLDARHRAARRSRGERPLVSDEEFRLRRSAGANSQRRTSWSGASGRSRSSSGPSSS